MRKKLMFVFCLISLFGFLYGFNSVTEYGLSFLNLLEVWIAFSLPLIIQLIYISIFRER